MKYITPLKKQICLLVILFFSIPSWTQPTPAQLPTARDKNIEWFRQAKFGMFIHWNPASLTSKEISFSRGGERRGFAELPTGEIPVEDYDNLYKKFNPTQFNAQEWAQLALDARMRYITFTTKHHDGFCMFDSAVTDYDIMNTPISRDLTGELAQACQKNGIGLGLYYSVPDWRHPDFLTENHWRYVIYMHCQIQELLSKYGQIPILWFDVAPDNGDFDLENLSAMIHRLQPGILMNNRGGMAGDFDTPEMRIGSFTIERPWEMCVTLGQQWSWKPNDKIKTLAECVRMLTLCVGHGGNFLLNVGPMPNGQIEDRQAARLREIGDWLDKYGQSIFDTTAGPYDFGVMAAATRNGKTVFIHVINWEDSIILKDIGVPIVSASILTGGKVSLKPVSGGTEVFVSESDRDPLDTIIQLTFAESVDNVVPVRSWHSGSLAYGKKVTVSSHWPKLENYFAASKAVDDDYEFGWMSALEDANAWMEVDLGEPMIFNHVRIIEPDPRIQTFVVEAKIDSEWKTITQGTTISPRVDLTFKSVTARYVRLRITQSPQAWGRTINEFQLFYNAETP